ncbi:MAG: sugar phosphorylase [Pseudomonadota bacterium]
MSPRTGSPEFWSSRDAVVITYGNTITDGINPPLVLLRDFLIRHLDGAIPNVHILPFFPYTSDDGFAVVDYMTVNSSLGDWHHIGRIAEQFGLMGDLVLNHISSSHKWMVQFVQGKKPGVDYIKHAEDGQDFRNVVRPRAHPLFNRVATAAGDKDVWCTFSHDQVDVDFGNPDVLIEYLRIMRFLIDRGLRIIRLDAVAYIWKVAGLPSIHLPEVHEIVRLMRTLCDHCSQKIVLITETNVPNHENLTYFGNRNEAHAIYNFSLPPLLLHTLLSRSSDALNRWLLSMPPAQPGCAYLNFTASHDGIGLRPVEGLLDEEDRLSLVEAVTGFGGLLSMRKMSDGDEHPYEMNISFYDAMKGTLDGPDRFQNDRFICSQTIMMSLEGIPAFYIHSLLATPNDQQGVQTTGQNRSINRSKLDYPSLESELADPDCDRARIFETLLSRIKLRAQQPAFHPNASQVVLQLGSALFGVERLSLDHTQTLISVSNISDVPQVLSGVSLNLAHAGQWVDLLSGRHWDHPASVLTLNPYETVWLTDMCV